MGTEIQEAGEDLRVAPAPKVSVLMVTYNHENFIAQAIESVLMQETDFEYELVIGEDCSTDNTRQIVLDFARRYPKQIRLLLPERNLGAHKNFVLTHQACRGEYVALLEGDDYWLRPEKLQIQVDFLDSNSEFVTCFHDVCVMDEVSGESFLSSRSINKDVFTIEDFLVANPIQTCSTMFRNRLFDNFPDWFHTLQLGDWPLHILNAQHGRVAFINEVLGTYRVHGGGIWSTQNEAKRIEATADMLEHFNRFFEFKYNSLISSSLSEMYRLLSVVHLDVQQKVNARIYFRKSLIQSFRARALSKPNILKRIFVVALRLYSPAIYSTIRKIAQEKRYGHVQVIPK